MGQISVEPVNGTRGRGPFPSCGSVESRAVCCFAPPTWERLEIRSASFITPFLCGKALSLFSSQCRPHRYLSALSAEASFACARSRLALMDDPSSLRARRASRGAILTDRRTEGQFAIAVFQSVQRGKTFIKGPVPPSSCLPVILSV